MNSKLKFLLEALIKTFKRQKDFCPFCNRLLDDDKRIIDRKAYFVKLTKCSGCNLLVRLPTDSVNENEAFYQEEYSQGSTTELPGDEELVSLLAVSFKDTERDYSYYLELLDKMGISKAARILDYGCSWGYGTYQLQQAGFDTAGYEISKPRLQYAVEKLGVRPITDFSVVYDVFDVFFSAHVLEHVPDLKFVFDLADRVLKPGGYFVAVCPNGSEAFQKKSPLNFHKLWGKVHPILLTDKFVLENFREKLRIVGSFPLSNMPEEMKENSCHIEIADKWQLVFVYQK